MKKYLIYIILSFLITNSVLARKTGCEGNCVDGFGKWTYTDKTTYEGNWVGTKKNGQGLEIWPNGYVYEGEFKNSCLLYTSPSPRDRSVSRMPSSA